MRRIDHFYHWLLSLVCLLPLVALPALAQVATGTYPFGSFGGGPEILNLGNLNVQLRIPVIAKPGRGIPLTYTLANDGSVWYPAGSNPQTWQPMPNWGWKGQTEVATGYITLSSAAIPCSGSYFTIFYGWTYHDPLGVAHAFNLTVFSSGACGQTSAGPQAANDGSGYSMSVTGNPLSATLTARSGQLINAPLQNSSGAGTATDSNGNQVTTNGSSFTDTLGTTALSISGSAPNPVTYTYTNASGGSSTVTVNYYQSVNVRSGFRCAGVSDTTVLNAPLVSSIVLPNGSSYSFTYEPISDPAYPGYKTGRIASVTLPTGGVISYTYTGGTNGINCGDGSASGLTRTVNPNASTGQGTWSYTRSNVSSTASTTTVTDPIGNVSTLNFVIANNNNFYETQRVLNQGASTLLQTITRCYNQMTFLSCGQANSLSLPITQLDVYSQWANGQNSTHEEKYGSVAGAPGYGLATEIKDWDYVNGGGALGALLRDTVISYANPGNNIFDRPAQISVYDGSATPVLKAQITYSYDETALTATTAPQHLAISGSRGNLTTLARWLNTTGLTLNSTFTYDDTGNVLSATDPGTHTTNFAYSSTYGYAYATQISYPATGSPPIAHNVRASYDANTGLVTATCGQNFPSASACNNTWPVPQPDYATYAYDSMDRPKAISYGDGGQTAFLSLIHI